MEKYYFEDDGSKFWVKAANGVPYEIAMNHDMHELYMPFSFLRQDLREKFAAAIKDGTAERAGTSTTSMDAWIARGCPRD